MVVHAAEVVLVGVALDEAEAVESLRTDCSCVDHASASVQIAGVWERAAGGAAVDCEGRRRVCVGRG